MGARRFLCKVLKQSSVLIWNRNLMVTIAGELRTTLALALGEEEINRTKHSTAWFCGATSVLTWRSTVCHAEWPQLVHQGLIAPWHTDEPFGKKQISTTFMVPVVTEIPRLETLGGERLKAKRNGATKIWSSPSSQNQVCYFKLFEKIHWGWVGENGKWMKTFHLNVHVPPEPVQPHWYFSLTPKHDGSTCPEHTAGLESSFIIQKQAEVSK